MAAPGCLGPLARTRSRRGDQPCSRSWAVGSAGSLARHGRLAQTARALPSHGRGHWFESSIAHGVSPHLHFEARIVGTALDPEPFLP